MNKETAERLRYVLQSPGWADIEQMIDEEIKENRDELLHIMAKKPDSLTGKTALKYAIRASALEDLKEQILDSQKVLSSQPRRAEG